MLLPNVTMVSNAELHKLITQFQNDFNVRCDNMAKTHEESNKVLAHKIDSFDARLDQLDQRLDAIDENNLAHTQKFTAIEDQRS